MSQDDAQAKRRWLAIQGTRLAGSAGALLGVALVARADAFPVKVLGIALALSALLMAAVVPRSLARRWRTPR